jgi:hypothetical protein
MNVVYLFFGAFFDDSSIFAMHRARTTRPEKPPLIRNFICEPSLSDPQPRWTPNPTLSRKTYYIPIKFQRPHLGSLNALPPSFFSKHLNQHPHPTPPSPLSYMHPSLFRCIVSTKFSGYISLPLTLLFCSHSIRSSSSPKPRHADGIRVRIIPCPMQHNANRAVAWLTRSLRLSSSGLALFLS